MNNTFVVKNPLVWCDFEFGWWKNKFPLPSTKRNKQSSVPSKADGTKSRLQFQQAHCEAKPRLIVKQRCDELWNKAATHCEAKLRRVVQQSRDALGSKALMHCEAFTEALSWAIHQLRKRTLAIRNFVKNWWSNSWGEKKSDFQVWAKNEKFLMARVFGVPSVQTCSSYILPWSSRQSLFTTSQLIAMRDKLFCSLFTIEAEGKARLSSSLQGRPNHANQTKQAQVQGNCDSLQSRRQRCAI